MILLKNATSVNYEKLVKGVLVEGVLCNMYQKGFILWLSDHPVVYRNIDEGGWVYSV